jgi:hypothetical protein
MGAERDPRMTKLSEIIAPMAVPTVANQTAFRRLFLEGARCTNILTVSYNVNGLEYALTQLHHILQYDVAWSRPSTLLRPNTIR